jgi:uncharacterized membrane protein
MSKGHRTFLIACGCVLAVAGLALVILHALPPTDVFGVVLGAIMASGGIGIAVLAAREPRRVR